MKTSFYLAAFVVTSLLAGLLPEAAIAQLGDRSSTTEVEDGGCWCNGERSESVNRIMKQLNRPLKSSGLQLNDVPISEAVALIKSEYEIPIETDWAALEDAGLGPGEQVSIDVQGISLKSALRLLLQRKQLTYIIANEVLIITTPEEADTRLMACVYNVQDLIGDDLNGQRMDALVDTIIAAIATETWAEAGGGRAAALPLHDGILVISQTTAVHEQVGELLTSIREARSKPRPASPSRPTQVTPSSHGEPSEAFQEPTPAAVGD